MTRRLSNAAAAFQLLRGSVGGSPSRLPYRVTRAQTAFLKSRSIYSLHALATGGDEPWQRACDQVWEIQAQETHRAVSALIANGVRTLTFKGSELVWRYFGGRALDVGGDADLLVPRGQIDEAKAVLYGLGFRQAEFDPATGGLVPRDVARVAALEGRHYELAPFVKAVELPQEPELVELARARNRAPLHLVGEVAMLVMEIDVHHNVATDTDVSGFFDRAVASSLGVGETLSPADHLWLNLSRYYNEVGIHGLESLRPIAYTLPLLTRDEINWSTVVSSARELALGPTLHYPLDLCARLAPGSVPDDALKGIASSADSRIRDWGWQLGKPFGFHEEFPSYAFRPATGEPEDVPARRR